MTQATEMLWRLLSDFSSVRAVVVSLGNASRGDGASGVASGQGCILQPAENVE